MKDRNPVMKTTTILEQIACLAIVALMVAILAPIFS